MDDILALLIPIVLAICIVVAIKIVVENRLRRRLSETHASEELVRALLDADERNRHLSSLKWGLVLVLMGVAFGVVHIFDLTEKDPATLGLLFLGAGLGLLAYYAAIRRQFIR